MRFRDSRGHQLLSVNKSTLLRPTYQVLLDTRHGLIIHLSGQTVSKGICADLHRGTQALDGPEVIISDRERLTLLKCNLLSADIAWNVGSAVYSINTRVTYLMRYS
jgi:hypothetical protein